MSHRSSMQSIRITDVGATEASLIQKKACWEIRRYNGSNFLREFKVPYLQKLVEEYNADYRRLQERGEAYVHWCDNIDRPQWVLAFDKGHRWGHMTTNLVKCINSKSTEAYHRKRSGATFSEFATQRIEANMQRAGNIIVNRFDRRNKVFEVEQLSCRHVIACCANQRLDWQIYVSDVYKMSQIQKVYREESIPLGYTET
ncbi:hypothetical protein AHAS_Ahas18G0197300 [Arachis hypogaea]